MRLLLTSQSIHNDAIAQSLRDLAVRPTTELRAVYVVTSHNAASTPDKTWLLNNMNSAHALGWKSFGVLDVAPLSSMPKDLWWPQLEAADVLFMGGGANHYLGYWLERSGVADVLPKWLESKVYVGSSAGSMYLTNSLRFSSQAMRQFAEKGEWQLDALGIEGQSSPRSLQLVDFELRPHHGDAHYPYITDELLQKAVNHVEKTLYAIDDDSALVVVDGAVRVVSEGAWKKFEPNQHK